LERISANRVISGLSNQFQEKEAEGMFNHR
jgi:hypothetical protein